MKPFDLEKALAGEKCVTRDGCDAAVHFRDERLGNYPLIGIVSLGDGRVVLREWRTDGKFADGNYPHDLFMAPKKKTVCINVYPNKSAMVYPTEQDADFFAAPNRIGNRAYQVEIDDE